MAIWGESLLGRASAKVLRQSQKGKAFARARVTKAFL